MIVYINLGAFLRRWEQGQILLGRLAHLLSYNETNAYEK
jgi:hypothetical protein